MEIALENLNTREERLEFDVVKDEVEAQLNNEVQLIENIKDKLKVQFKTSTYVIRNKYLQFCCTSYFEYKFFYYYYYRLGVRRPGTAWLN